MRIISFTPSLYRLTVFCLAALLLSCCKPQTATDYTLAIRNVTVIDVEKGVEVPGATVLIQDSLIKAIYTEEIQLSDTLPAIEGSGQYLVPGFWDMHVHVGLIASPDLHLPLFLANGITGIRDMSDRLQTEGTPFANIDDKRRWHQQAVSGEIDGPRLVAIASPIVNGTESRQEGFPDYIGPGNETQARELVNYYREKGYDFIKVYNNLSPEAYFALADEAKKAGIGFAGHRPLAISAAEAAQAGQESIEHARLFLQESNPKSAYYRTEKTRHDIYDKQYMVKQFDEATFAIACSTMVAHGMYFCPTHVTREFDASVWDSTYLATPLLGYVPEIQHRFWMQDVLSNREHEDTVLAEQVLKDFYKKGLEITGKAHQMGLKILVGTDANDSYIISGFSYHEELKKLAEAGMSPADILRAATLTAAEFEGLQQSFGSIAPGKHADMVLLAENPLTDISHSNSIQAVFLNGRYYDAGKLEQMKAQVEAAATSFTLP